ALFRMIGAKRTRLVAQVVAAVIGAAFVIGLQVAAILSYGNLSRFALLQSDWLLTRAPDAGSALWWSAPRLRLFPCDLATTWSPPPASRTLPSASRAGPRAFAAGRRAGSCARRN